MAEILWGIYYDYYYFLNIKGGKKKIKKYKKAG